MAGDRQARVAVGRIAGLFGVRGWVKVYSYTRPRENILDYSPWLLDIGGQWRTVSLVDGRVHGKTLVVKLEGYDDRDAAAVLLDCEVAVYRSQLPRPAPGDYYWNDLIGLRAVNRKGEILGEVTDLMETGSADVLVVRGEREHLIPFVPDLYVISVDLDAGLITLDWHAEDASQ